MLRIVFAFIGLMVVILSLGGIKASQFIAMGEAGKAFVPPPESVSTTEVKKEVWERNLRAVGSLVANQAIVVSSEVPGTVSKVRFKSGDTVRRGQTLVELDTSLEVAQLAAAQASADLSNISLERARKLVKRKVNTQAELDAAEAESKRAEAQVSQIEAQIEKKTIRAPFSGRLGISNVDLGEIVSPGQALVSLQAIATLYVDFYLPQQDATKVAEGQAISLRFDADKTRVWEGKVVAIEPSVDVATRNLQVRGEIANEDGALKPGMFVEVTVSLPEEDSVLIIPATSILYAPYGNSVFVVKKGENGALTVDQALVEVLDRRGDFVAIKSSLQAGQTIVETGAFKLRKGMAVTIQNQDSVKPSLSPTPEDT